tara:strand:+ start:975 stop:1244 length:270 start_codon:yes stop_codon:yes gene_type:complete
MKRDHKAEYKRRKELKELRKQQEKEKHKETAKYLNAAIAAHRTVITGGYMNHDEWSYDLDRANECIKMAFEKNDDLFPITKALTRKYMM